MSRAYTVYKKMRPWMRNIPKYAQDRYKFYPPNWTKNWVKARPWHFTEGVGERLPEHYIARQIDTLVKEPEPVHFIPDPAKFKWNPHRGNRERVQNLHLPLLHPPEADQGLWGGESVIKGFIKNSKSRRRVPRFWMPSLKSVVLYSEILDRAMRITVTNRTLMKIDEAYGFDFYILKTHENDLKSKLGMDLKREMHVVLAKQSMYPKNPEKKKQILDKYKDFIIPEDEAEWIGLSLGEACSKQQVMEINEFNDKFNPPVFQLEKELLLKLNYALSSGKINLEKDSTETILDKIKYLQVFSGDRVKQARRKFQAAIIEEKKKIEAEKGYELSDEAKDVLTELKEAVEDDVKETKGKKATDHKKSIEKKIMEDKEPIEKEITEDKEPIEKKLTEDKEPIEKKLTEDKEPIEKKTETLEGDKEKAEAADEEKITPETLKTEQPDDLKYYIHDWEPFVKEKEQAEVAKMSRYQRLRARFSRKR